MLIPMLNRAMTASSLVVSGAEIAFFCACLRGGSPEPGAVEALNGVNWSSLIHFAERHGLIPILQQCINQTRHMPSVALTDLQNRVAENARASLLRTTTLLRACRVLEDANIRGLAYKGPVLAQELYGDVAKRQYADVDLLIHAEDAYRARDALEQAGFVSVLRLRPVEERAHLVAGCEWSMTERANGVTLELQWQLAPQYFGIQIDFEGLWQRSVEVQVGPRTVRTLSPEDNFVILAVHGAKHAFVRLCWIADLVALAAQDKINWRTVIERARRLHVTRILGVASLLAHELAAMLLSAELEELIAGDDTIPLLMDRIWRDLQLESPLCQPPALAYFRLMATMRERLYDRLRFFARLATTPTHEEWATCRLPARLFPLYRLVRFGRLLAKAPKAFRTR